MPHAVSGLKFADVKLAAIQVLQPVEFRRRSLDEIWLLTPNAECNAGAAREVLLRIRPRRVGGLERAGAGAAILARVQVPAGSCRGRELQLTPKPCKRGKRPGGSNHVVWDSRENPDIWYPGIRAFMDHDFLV